MNKLTIEQKAINAATLEHIGFVRLFIDQIIIELLRRTEQHDKSKLTSPEVGILTEWTPKLAGMAYGSDEYKDALAQMQPVIEHHYAHNRHHPEHFSNGINEMTLIDLVEMFCDWHAATLRHANGDLEESIKINADRFDMAPQLIQILLNTAKIVH